MHALTELAELLAGVKDSPNLKPHEKKIIERVLEREEKRMTKELSDALDYEEGNAGSGA